MFSDKTRTCLYAAGWSEDYMADISFYRQSMASKGCALPAVAIDFLIRFGRLQIAYPTKVIVKNFSDHNIISLDGDKSGEPCDDLEFMAEKTGVDCVCRIGWLDDDFILLMDLEGNVYLFSGNSYGGKVRYVASSGEGAIEAFCSRKYGEDIGTIIKTWVT